MGSSSWPIVASGETSMATTTAAAVFRSRRRPRGRGSVWLEWLGFVTSVPPFPLFPSLVAGPLQVCLQLRERPDITEADGEIPKGRDVLTAARVLGTDGVVDRRRAVR